MQTEQITTKWFDRKIQTYTNAKQSVRKVKPTIIQVPSFEGLTDKHSNPWRN